MYRQIFHCLGAYKKYALLAPVTVIGEVILEVLIPMMMARIINIGISNGDVPYVIKMGAVMIITALLSLCFGALSGRFAAVAATGLSKGLRKKLFHQVQDFSFSNIDKFSTASLITRLTTDVTNTQNAFQMVIRMLVRAPIMLVLATFMAVRINASLAGIFLVAVPVLAVSLGLIISLAFPRFTKMLKKYDALNADVQENLIAIRVVKAFVREKFENEKFHNSADLLRAAQKKAEKIIIFNMPIMQFVMYGCMIAVCWFGGMQIISGHMETGDLMSFFSYLTQILMSLMMVAMICVMLVLSKASITRILEIFDESPDIQNPSASAVMENGSIVFENVNFSYGNDPQNLTLQNISLTTHSGETVGIIGGTGSAKTTLVQLIPRLYDVLQGRVLVGGHDVREYDLKSLRDQVAMVLQKNVLFSGSIRSNLKWGNENASEQEISAACQAAQAENFILSFPDGYDTDLGQGGVNVSGGQKQRLCIARALLKKPKIIILDDSTSAVDTATDSKIRAAFREELAGTTTIIIAQRISSICDADKIIVLNEGKIDAIGTHEELLKNNAIYREVYESQQKGVA